MYIMNKRCHDEMKYGRGKRKKVVYRGASVLEKIFSLYPFSLFYYSDTKKGINFLRLTTWQPYVSILASFQQHFHISTAALVERERDSQQLQQQQHQRPHPPSLLWPKGWTGGYERPTLPLIGTRLSRPRVGTMARPSRREATWLLGGEQQSANCV